MRPWTITFDDWKENQSPPDWLIQARTDFAGAERTDLIGHVAPQVSGRTLVGAPFRLSALHGKIVVLDFWATYCGPCSEEMAALERLKATLPAQDVEIVSVTEDTATDARRWMDERKRTLPVVLVKRDSAFKDYGVDGIPQVVMVDRDGTIIKHWVGLRREQDLRAVIQPMLTR